MFIEDQEEALAYLFYKAALAEGATLRPGFRARFLRAAKEALSAVSKPGKDLLLYRPDQNCIFPNHPHEEHR